MSNTSHVSPLLPAILLLGSGVAGLVIGRFARINPIIVFFAIGVLLGPQVADVVSTNSGTIPFLAEIGVCFLMFDVGLHLSVNELRKGWRAFISAGVSQFLFGTALLAGVLNLGGTAVGAAIVLGAILSLSSTALVLKLLADEQEESSPIGRKATEILVFQDIAAILLLVILAGGDTETLGVSTFLIPLLKVSGIGLVIILVGKLALKPLFHVLIRVKNDEVFTATALLIVLTASWATESMGLSLALGAFLGGLALSESTYAYLVRSEVAPFRSLLLGLFFISVGLQLDVVWMVNHIGVVVGGLLVFVAVKGFSNYLAMRVVRIETGGATYLAALLSQGSEFAFVLLALALQKGVVSPAEGSLASALVGLSLASTPFVAAAGCWLSRSRCEVVEEAEATVSDPKEVIIVRMDEYGRSLATLLEEEGIPYRGHDLDRERIAYAESRGYRVFYSDPSRPRTLGRVSLGKAIAVVSFLDAREIVEPLVLGLRKVSPGLPFFAASETPEVLGMMYDRNVEHAYAKSDLVVSRIFEEVLKVVGYSSERIATVLRRLDTEQDQGGVFAARAVPGGLVSEVTTQ